ncbi:MAG: hypothetical protein J5764_01725, partial [Bacteroidales bacterium]|nr:hypothetical protein [Bacteroidales bacterium]
MKKILVSLAAALFIAGALMAQTPEEIIARMNQETDRFDTEGCSMVMDMTLPILGTYSSQMYLLGDKSKTVIKVKDAVSII